MNNGEIREPIQKRSIEKKEKIIKAGFDLICEKGYHNTNTVEIAKKAGVSTGIIYQYFKDKHDIFICGLKKYADHIFYPMPDIWNSQFNKNDFSEILNELILLYVNNHKLSKSAHEEIMAMTHSDKDVSYYFHKRELDTTYKISNILQKNGFSCENIHEKVHIVIGMIDNLCHEIVYHKHENLNYPIMTNIVIDAIVNILE